MSQHAPSPSANRFNFRAWNMRSAPSEMLYYGRDFYTLNSWKCDRGGIHSVGISPGNGQFQILVGDNPAAMPSALGDCILMQSTGLIDKNGKEIFEGDVVREKWPQGHEDYIVVWLGHEWALRVIYREAEYNAGFPNKSVTVIGDIYQNPDLLPKA